MDRLQDISRHLLAAGGTPSKDGRTTHLTYEEEGSIRMRTWTGSELIDDELVADEVRPGTSAPIVNRSNKKVFVVHKNHSIQCFIDPLRDDNQVEEDEIDDDAPWNEEKIIGVDTRVHQRSQLAVSYDKNTVFLFYQKPDGSLGAINEYNNKWRAIKLPAVAALDGTPLATCNTSSAVFLFYISVDRTVRYMENSEGEWKDLFFSGAEIIDPDAKLPGPTVKLTIAEDRHAFERIRPMVFCLESNILSIIKFHSMDVESIGIMEGARLVPLLGDRERSRYYFWSPYPFYTMNKRSHKNQAQATTPRQLWSQYVNCSSPTPYQRERSNSSATKHLNKFQEPFNANQRAPTMNNKTPATVGVETTNAEAIISPRKSEQKGTFSSNLFAGLCNIPDLPNAIRKYFGNGRNEDATEEDAPGTNNSNHADAADVSPGSNELEMNGMENNEIESNEVNTGKSETEELKQPGNEEIKVDEVNEARVEDDESEEAGSEDTEEDTDLEGTDSEEAETTPSEIEEDQTEEAQTKEAQTEEVQTEDIQKDEVQLEEVQTEEIQTEEAQTKEVQLEEVQTNDAKPEELEAEISTVEEIEREIETKEQEPRNAKCVEIEPEANLDRAEVPAGKTSTTKVPVVETPVVETPVVETPVVETPVVETPVVETPVVETPVVETPVVETPVVETPVTKGCSKEPDTENTEESGLKDLDPEESEHIEIPTFDKGKDAATTNTPVSKKPIFNTPQDVREDLTEHLRKTGLDKVIPKDSPFISTVANKAIEHKNNKENLLNRDEDIQGTTRLNIYQPVLYCDDSTSMRAGTRLEDQKEMVRRVTRISTCLVPSGYGTSLQFINHVRDVHDDSLSHKKVMSIMDSVKPSGHTRIGTNLKKKILRPLVYDVIKNNKRLERPILVSCITDGCPSDESVDTLKKEILKCTQFLAENGYPPSILRFQISQIGNSSRADKFLQELSRDPDLQEVLYVTAQHLDDKFEEYRDNEVMLERWLLRTLLGPIMMGQNTDDLNL